MSDKQPQIATPTYEKQMFVNMYGERFVFEKSDKFPAGVFYGDETDWKTVEPEKMLNDFILSEDETPWVFAMMMRVPALTRAIAKKLGVTGKK